MTSVSSQTETSSPFAIARGNKLAPWTALVMTLWSVAGLMLLLTIARNIQFPPPAHTTAVGRVTVSQYPKYQESLYFALAVGGIPAVAGLGWLVWVLTGAGLARVTRTSLPRLLRLTALGSLAWLLLLPNLLHLIATPVRTWCLAITLLLGWSVLCALYCRLRPQPASEIPVDEPTPVPTKQWPRALRILGWLLLYIAIPCCLYVWRYSPNIDGGLDLFHEGEFIIPMQEINHGAVPYRDIYLQHGLFHNALVPWLGGRLFGPTFAGVRTIHRLIEPLGYIAVYLLGLSLFRSRWLTPFVLAFILCGPNFQASPRTIFGMLSIACVAAAIRQSSEFLFPKNRAWWLGSSGVFASLAFWYSVEVGFYTFAAIGLFLIGVAIFQRRVRPLLIFGIGAFIGFWIVGWYFLIHGALGDLFRNVMVQCRYQNEVWGLVFPSFLRVLDPLVQHPEKFQWPQTFTTGALPYYLPPAAFLLASLFLTYRFVRGILWKNRTGLTLLLLLVAGCFYFRSTLGRTDTSHRAYGIDFLLLTVLFLPDQLIGYGAAQLFRRHPTVWKNVIGGFALTAGAAIGWAIVAFSLVAYGSTQGFQTGWHQLGTHKVVTIATNEPLPGIGILSVPKAQVGRLKLFVTILQERTKPEDRILDFSNQAALLFLADRRTATRYFQICYAVTDPLQQEVIDMLGKDRPLVIFKSGSGSEHFDGIPQAQRTPLIGAYLATQYETNAIPATPLVIGLPR